MGPRLGQQVESGQQPDKHALFTAQAIKQGVEINGVEAMAIAGRGMGLVARNKILKGQQLMFVPEAAMIKPLPHHIKDATLSPQAKLTASLVEMRATGEQWLDQCRQVWPSSNDFASSLWWFQHAHEAEGWESNLPLALSQPRRRLQADLINDLTSIYGSSSSRQFEREHVHLWTIANTRSFSFKPTGHRAGIMVMCPFLDYMNHCPSNQGCQVRQDMNGYTLIADRHYGVGEEIMATYGAHSNDKLLVHYGFLVPGSKDDSISLDDVILPELNDIQRQSLESVGFIGNYSLTPQSKEICFRTQVAIRSMLTTSNEWEFFMNCGEDIAEDQDDNVEAALICMIGGYLPKLRSRREAVYSVIQDGSMAAKVEAVALCMARMDQVETALSGFCGEDGGGSGGGSGS